MHLRNLAVASLAALALLWGPGILAEGWNGTLGLALWSRSTSGSEGSFRSQLNLDEGLSLEQLDLRYQGEEEKPTHLTVRASGFGGADPAQSFGLDLRLAKPWRFALDYDRRESFFELAESGEGRRADDWDVERWHAGVAWSGWKAALLRVDLRSHQRQGTVDRPLFGLNELYPLRVDLDETMEEAALSIETRTLPFTLLFEQSLATYERHNRRRPAGASDLEGDDLDRFATAEDRRDEQRDVPTSRLVATWTSPKVELAASFLYSPAELDGTGPVSEGFDILGGLAGRVEFIDDVLTSGSMDTTAGNLRLGVRLASQWTLRLEGDYRDTTTDAALLGERIVRVTNPFGGVFDLIGPRDATSVFDVTDDHGRLTVEWSGGGWAVWGGAFTASRDVRFTLAGDDPVGGGGPGLDATRDSDGTLLGVSWSRKGVTGSAEYERGTFDRFVFRTDPETVDRLTLRLRAEIGKGWHLRAKGRFEQADNPAAPVAVPESTSGLDRSSDAWGAGLTWDSDDGKTGFGLDLDQADLATRTDLVLPDGRGDVSVYDLSLLSASLHGRAEIGKLRITGSATRVDDSGDTWPVESWIARARIGYRVRTGLEVAALGEYYSYDEARATRDDFDVTRYGIGLEWSF